MFYAYSYAIILIQCFFKVPTLDSILLMNKSSKVQFLDCWHRWGLVNGKYVSHKYASYDKYHIYRMMIIYIHTHVCKFLNYICVNYFCFLSIANFNLSLKYWNFYCIKDTWNVDNLCPNRASSILLDCFTSFHPLTYIPNEQKSFVRDHV